MNTIVKLFFLFITIMQSIGFTQSECDGERYNNEIFSNINVFTDIEYGENVTEDILGTEYTQTLYLDVYVPENDYINDRPLVIFMFGGAFVTGSKNSPVMQELCTRYAKMGYVASSIDYRLTPTLIWNGTEENAYKAVIKAIHDLKSSIRYFRMNDQLYDDFGIDTSRIYSGGSSAGAIASVNAAYINDISEVPEFIFDYVMEQGELEGFSGNSGYNSEFYGVINLCGAIGHYDWIAVDDIPIVSIHGDEDTVVPYADDLVTLFGINLQVYGSYIIQQTMINLGNQSALYTFEGEGHTPYGYSDTYMDVTVDFTKEFMYELVCEESQSGEITIDHNEHWNLIGLPLIVENSNVDVIFPTSNENTLFSYGQGYVLENSLDNGIGYWLRFDSAGTSTLTGEILNEISISLYEGWNLITGLSEKISIYSASDPGNIIVENTLYGFSEGYFITDTLYTGHGYWLRAFQDGAILLNLENSQRRNTKDYDLTDRVNSFKIKGMNLFFGVDIPSNEKIHYSLPPKPPVQTTDIRFSDDTKLCSQNICVIEIMSDKEFLQFECEIKGGETWELIDRNGHVTSCSGTQLLDLNDYSETYILRKITPQNSPNTFSLLPAFPNPFNPNTTLRYILPRDAFVTLTVFDMFGREITQLVNADQASGFNSVQWNATDHYGRPVSAGVYLYRIKTDSFIQTKKMVLLN